MELIVYSISFSFILFIVYRLFRKREPLSQPPVSRQKKILKQVSFYNQLNKDDKAEFEMRVSKFLGSVRIQGVDTTIEDSDKIFVAAAAIIPIFAFKKWEHRNIHDVLLYPTTFNHNFKTSGKERNVLGMVGDGAMGNLMILSLPELRNGFLNASSKTNTAIHEFVHLIDKDDGYVDGCPEDLLPHKHTIPWLQRIHREIELIHKGKSDINPYGATNEAEFLAVASEYFFKQPHLMEKKHPELYKSLTEIFLSPQAHT